MKNTVVCELHFPLNANLNYCISDRPPTQLMGIETNITSVQMDALVKCFEEEERRKKYPVTTFILRDEPKLRDSFRAQFFTGIDRYDR